MTDGFLAGRATRPLMVTVGLGLVGLCALGSWGLAVAGAAAFAGFLVAQRQGPLGPLGAGVFWVTLPLSMWMGLAGDGSIFSRLHPGTIFLVSLLGSGWKPSRHSDYGSALPSGRVEKILVVLQLAFLASTGLMTFVTRGVRGLALLADNYVGPFLLFWSLVWAFRAVPASRFRAGTAVAVVCAALGTMGLVEFLAHQNPLYEPFYGDVGWFPYATGAYRSTVSFGAPLSAANALMVGIVAIPLVATIRLRVLLTLIILVGVLSTGSRSATALGLAISPLVVLAVGERHAGAVSPKQIFMAVGTLAGVGVLLMIATPLGQLVAGRAAGAWQSTAVRFISADYFLQSAGNYAVSGVGLGGSTDVSTAAFGGYISFENPWIMLAVDVGIPLTILYAGVVAVALVPSLAARPRPWAAIAAFVGLIGMETAYNAFGSRGIAGYCLWAALALARPTSDSYTPPTAS